MRNSHRTGVSTFASRTSPSTDQSLQKSFHLYNAPWQSHFVQRSKKQNKFVLRG